MEYDSTLTKVGLDIAFAVFCYFLFFRFAPPRIIFASRINLKRISVSHLSIKSIGSSRSSSLSIFQFSNVLFLSKHERMHFSFFLISENSFLIKIKKVFGPDGSVFNAKAPFGKKLTDHRFHDTGQNMR